MPFTCYDRVFWAQKFWEDPIAPNDPDEIPLGKLWSRGSVVSKFCAEKEIATGRLIGTPFVARDIVRVAEALGEDGLVRYWGRFRTSIPTIGQKETSAYGEQQGFHTELRWAPRSSPCSLTRWTRWFSMEFRTHTNISMHTRKTPLLRRIAKEWGQAWIRLTP